MGDKVRVAIVGSGPAGLSAAAHAAQRGMSHILLEKTDHLSDTIFKYQKGKHVMATPSNLVLRSDLDFDAGKREVILDTWDRQVAEGQVAVRTNADVTGISGQAGAFTLTLQDGSTVEAEAVVLAIGTQGNPNLLKLPGADLPHVQYQLDDPTEYVDEHITVIGSGDAGIENALGLAADEAQGNVVTILNRRADFARAKGANVKLLEEAEADGRILVRRETSPIEVREGEIVLETRDGQETIPCHRIIARTGSQPPRAFVEQCGVEFASDDRAAFPKLTPSFETTQPGIHVIGALAGQVIPENSVLVSVVVYCFGMALFTMIMGNAFAAFPVMAAAIGIPLLVEDYGGNPAVIGAVGMLAGFCGTLLTPMAANFNIVPAALLELDDQNGVIRQQIWTAIPLWGCNVAIIYLAGFWLWN